jgi:hypothetical protein
MAESPPCRIGAIDETTTLATCFLSSNARFLEEAFGAMSYPLGIGAANCSQGQPRCREASLNGCVMPSPCHSYIGKISFLRGQHALCLVLWVCARARSHYRTLVRGRREAASRCSFRRTANDCASGEVIPTCAMAESGRSGSTELACVSCCPRASIGPGGMLWAMERGRCLLLLRCLANGRSDIWALREKTSLLHRSSPDPQPVTTGPLSYSSPG